MNNFPKIIQEIQKENNNNKCFICLMIAPNYICTYNSIFLCFCCASIFKEVDKQHFLFNIVEYKTLITDESKVITILLKGGNLKLQEFFMKYNLNWNKNDINENFETKVINCFKTKASLSYRGNLKNDIDIPYPDEKYGGVIDISYLEEEDLNKLIKDC